MNKIEFLRELENNLINKIKDDDLQNILMDYEEIFESNKAENKSEDETSGEIGSPAIVAKNILDDYTYMKSSPPNIEKNYQIAPSGKRIIAFIMDSILSLLPLFIFGPRAITSSLLFPLIWPSMPLFFGIMDYNPTTTQIATNLTLLCFFWLYGTVSMIILRNKTIGMHIMQIKVIKTNNSKIKILDVIIRQFLGKIIIPSFTFGISNLVSFFWMLFSKRNNTVQDKIAGTLVVEDTKGSMVR